MFICIFAKAICGNSRYVCLYFSIDTCMSCHPSFTGLLMSVQRLVECFFSVFFERIAAIYDCVLRANKNYEKV